jgi:hypothetical protein
VLAREPGDFHALMTRLAMRRKPAGTVIHDHR